LIQQERTWWRQTGNGEGERKITREKEASGILYLVRYNPLLMVAAPEIVRDRKGFGIFLMIPIDVENISLNTQPTSPYLFNLRKSMPSLL
jgi:hypothetical protein